MIKGKTIYFGYGDVLVGSTQYESTIHLTEIEPPKEIGTSPAIGTFIELQKIVLEVNDEHLRKISLVRDKIITSFVIDDYTLDFSNFHEGSIKVVSKHLKNALYYDTLCLAC